jgi:hypothetical protein
MTKLTKAFVKGLNETIAKTAETDPEKCTITCGDCKKTYVAKCLADLYVCPLCGGTPIDEEECDEE